MILHLCHNLILFYALEYKITKETDFLIILKLVSS